MANIWDDESVSEYELIAEDAKEAEEMAEAHASVPPITEASDEVLEEIAEESAFKLNKKESNVIFNARLRLEQAKLYEMLINHNLFDGVDASPDAINNVQNELKAYIVKRLEILLGLREPVVRVETAVAELPFNDIEIDFLKQLAYKGTNGASENGVPVTPKIEKQQVVKSLAPAKAQEPARLKSLAVPKKKAEPAPQPEAPKRQVQETKAPAPTRQPVKTQQAQKPVKKAAEPKIRPSGMGRDLSPQEIELLARQDLQSTPKKPFHEMTAKEKAERIKEVNEKHKRPSVPGRAAPMPSANELEMKYMNQQQNRSLSRNQTDQFNTILANALAVQKNRGEDHE